MRLSLLRDAIHDLGKPTRIAVGKLHPHKASFQRIFLDTLGIKLRAQLAPVNVVNLSQGSRPEWKNAVKSKVNTRRLDSSYVTTLLQFSVWGQHRDTAQRVSISHPTSL